MSNAFSKEERVAFEDFMEGFNDAEVMSRNVSKYSTDGTMMARANDTIWIPQPYIAQSFNGMDQTANFKDVTQMSVPATIGYSQSAPWIMDAKELRDALQEKRLGEAAKQRLASDINQAVLGAAANLGGHVIARPAAATGFDDVALCDSVFNEVGVPDFDRVLALSSRDYNSMAANLANRQTLQQRTETAYDTARIGMVSGFDTFKLGYSKRIGQAAGGAGITISTLAAANNYYVPKATRTAVTGEVSNVDNRFQTITVSATAGVVAGDCFTIGNITQAHLISKQDTGQKKTFRVVEVVDGTHLKITPPIVSAQGASDAEKQYQNCVVTTPAANSPIAFLNVKAAAINPFWQKDAIRLLPASYALSSDNGAAILRGKTDSGIEVVMQKQYDIATMKTRYRVDTLFGVVNLQPEQSGIMIFGQT